MTYRNRYRSKPHVRTITVKYAGKCACCGGSIAAGEAATYYPVGTIAGRTEGAIAHIGGLDGTSARCSAALRADPGANSYAGDGLDSRQEDAGAEICFRGES